MSLLLKALQRASKSRESLPRRAPGPAGATATGALELEPGDIEPPRPARRALDFGSGQVATGAASKSAGRSADAMEWVREHPVHLFAAGALVFLAGYFVYVYLAINHPGFFTRSSPQDQIAQPVPPPRPVTPPPGTAPVAEVLPPAQPSAPVPDLQIPAEPASPAPPQVAASSSLPPLPQPAPESAGVRETPPASAPPRPVTAPVTASADDAPPPIATAPRPRRIRAAPTIVDKVDRPRAVERPLEEGVQVRPTTAGDHAAARTTEGWEALQRQDFAKAQSSYEAALAADPRNIDALLGLAATAWQQGRPDVASEQYYRVLQLDPQNAQAQSGLIGLAGQVDPQASESRLKQLISHDPSAFLYASLGHLYAGQAQWSQAQQAYFQAYQLESANPDYAYNLAVGLEHLGQRGIAVGYYRKALDLARARGRAGFDQAQVTARVAKLAAATE